MDPQKAAPAPSQDNYAPNTRVGNALTVTQQGERTVCEIKRHPIGIIGIYVATGLLMIIVAVFAFVLLPHVIASDSITKIGAAIFLIVTIFCLIFAFISTKVYAGNSWVVTTDSLTQIDQNSLFHRQSSQLSLGNLEDVTAEQNGIFPHMFNYGWLRVETAGERSKFAFQYCPNPNYYAQQILSAREDFEQHRSGDDDLQRTYRGEGSYAQSSQQQYQTPPYQQPQPQQPAQAGDPGYGAFRPSEQPPAGPGSPVDYPSDSEDQGVNINV